MQSHASYLLCDLLWQTLGPKVSYCLRKEVQYIPAGRQPWLLNCYNVTCICAWQFVDVATIVVSLNQYSSIQNSIGVLTLRTCLYNLHRCRPHRYVLHTVTGRNPTILWLNMERSSILQQVGHQHKPSDIEGRSLFGRCKSSRFMIVCPVGLVLPKHWQHLRFAAHPRHTPSLAPAMSIH